LAGGVFQHFYMVMSYKNLQVIKSDVVGYLAEPMGSMIFKDYGEMS
jgi:hypothetical protein